MITHMRHATGVKIFVNSLEECIEDLLIIKESKQCLTSIEIKANSAPNLNTIDKLITMLGEVTTLSSFAFESPPFKDEFKGIIETVILTNTELKKLVLSYNQLGGSLIFEIFEKISASKIQYLCLGANNINSEDAIKISKLLVGCNQSLTYLGFHSNKIDLSSIITIIDLFKASPLILNFNGNPFSLQKFANKDINDLIKYFEANTVKCKPLLRREYDCQDALKLYEAFNSHRVKEKQARDNRSSSASLNFFSQLPTFGALKQSGNGLLWKIKWGEKESYIMATNHSDLPPITDKLKPIRSYIEKAEIVCLELANDKRLEVRKFFEGKQDLPLGLKLSQLIDRALYEKVKEFVCETLKIDDSDWLCDGDRKEPWALTFACSVKAFVNSQYFLDAQINQLAEEKKIKVVSIDTKEAQIGVITSIYGLLLPLEEQLKELLRVIDNVESSLIIRQKLLDAYSANDLWGCFDLASKGYQFNDQLQLPQRDSAMTSAALPYIQSGNAFIAVGALHLPGMLFYLEKYGCQLTCQTVLSYQPGPSSNVESDYVIS